MHTCSVRIVGHYKRYYNLAFGGSLPRAVSTPVLEFDFPKAYQIQHSMMEKSEHRRLY